MEKDKYIKASEVRAEIESCENYLESLESILKEIEETEFNKLSFNMTLRNKYSKNITAQISSQHRESEMLKSFKKEMIPRYQDYLKEQIDELKFVIRQLEKEFNKI